jgi:tetratricopeptide (TPR) repeat protein
MRSLRLLTPFGLLAVLFFPADVYAQSYAMNDLQVRVQVRYPDGTTAPMGVFVALELENGELVEQSQTDSFGRCHFFPTTGHAVYLVRVKQPGYREIKMRVDLQNSQSGIANLTLEPISGETPPSAAKDGTGVKGATVSAADLAVPEPARKEYGLGRDAMEKHDLDGGVAHLKKALELHDQFPQAYILLGMAYNGQKKWKDAQDALEKAIRQDTKAVEAYFELGTSLNQQKEYAGAVKVLNQGLQLNPDAPDSAGVHYELARAYLALGQWQEANPHAAKAVVMQPHVASWHILMGNINLKKGDGEGAITEFQAYLELDPDGPGAGPIHEIIPKIRQAMSK